MNDKKRILVVDDEQDLCDILQVNLTAAGYEADVAYSAAEALALGPEHYSLLILDVMMPGMSGFELAADIRGMGLTMPVIFLTAKDTEEDKLQGFSLGADDYVSKPFSVRELMARVKAVLNRSLPHPAQSDGCLTFDRLVIDTTQMTATVDGEPLNLTKTELELLRLLLGNSGKVFSRQQLLDELWPKDVIVTERTVDVNITRLRKKLGAYGQRIVTRQGYGYLFEP